MFADRYRKAFADIGVALTERHALNPKALDAMRLEGLRLPPALREYYLVAGAEKRLNHSFNRLLAPEDVGVEAGRIVFMEENQAVVYWGVPDEGDNPTVQQGVNGENEALEWHSEEVSCAEFLEVMLYMQATFGEGGDFEYPTSAVVPADFHVLLEREARRVGRIGEMSAFNANGVPLTFLKWFDDEHRVFAGFRTRKAQRVLARVLGVEWEEL